MRSLTVLFCGIGALLFTGAVGAFAQGSSVRAGVYHFIDDTARESYMFAPTVMVGRGVWERSLLDLYVWGGLAANRFRFEGESHRLYMVPLMATMYYNLPNPGVKVWPGMGLGMGLMGKGVRNIRTGQTDYVVNYGYNASGRLNVPLSDDLVLMLEMTCNLLLPARNDEMDITGVILTVGLDFPSKQSRMRK